MMMMIHWHRVFSSVVNSAACYLRRIAKFCANSLPGRALTQISSSSLNSSSSILLHILPYPCTSVSLVRNATHSTAYPTARSAKIHIGKSTPCRAANLGVREIVLETRQMSWWAALEHGPRAYLAAPTSLLGLAVSKKVGVGVYYRYTMYILSI